MKENPCIDSIEIFEWYDGLVLGLSHTEDMCFLTCLLGFNPDTQQKRYLLASLSQEQVKLLKALFQKNGAEAFNKLVLSDFVAQNANLFLASEEPEKGKIPALTRIKADQKLHLNNLAFPLIDNAVTSNAIAQWLK